ncbi:RHS repeat-associated core domain-containing protein [Pseudomonas sp. 39004]|jgi:RHS repeat-associated protein|uniref:RHS repeat-associated core domain-containing protein n=1 Tax=Pseudomonas sp. 39004 TaxID=2967213 RepID=UPI00236471DF|nr:RHS repeat-associated core domain-containing protein [Pseudomonas sp. 39004]MDD1963213.1 RHS repeat-associated core domain-containing protein [Pseudomonas sp. 39004]
MSRENHLLFFYQGSKLVTVKQGKHHRAIFRIPDLPLAEQQTADSTTVGLLTTDDKGSVLWVQEADEDEPHGYSAYGHNPGLPSSRTLLGFNGEYFERASGCYPLGSGYRSYSSGLMRFQSPDDWSPFGQGGINAYCYCQANPVNAVDPSGHKLSFLANGQIMRVTRNSATPVGRWLNPSTLNRTTSLETLGAGSPRIQPRRPSLPERSPIAALTVALQHVPPVQADIRPTPVQWVSLTARREPLLPPPSTASRPTAIVRPLGATQEPSRPTHVHELAPGSRSTDSSRDTTPSSSRSATPPGDAALVDYHVRVASNIRNHPNYSRRHDP